MSYSFTGSPTPPAVFVAKSIQAKRGVQETAVMDELHFVDSSQTPNVPAMAQWTVPTAALSTSAALTPDHYLQTVINGSVYYIPLTTMV